MGSRATTNTPHSYRPEQKKKHKTHTKKHAIGCCTVRYRTQFTFAYVALRGRFWDKVTKWTRIKGGSPIYQIPDSLDAAALQDVDPCTLGRLDPTYHPRYGIH